MFTLELRILLLFDTDDEEKCLSEYFPLEFVNCTFKTLKKGEDEGLEISKDDIVISDDIERLRPYFHSYRRGGTLIFCGDSEVAEKIIVEEVGNLIDVWPRRESSYMRRCRFQWLIERIRYGFEGWLYKNLLMTTIDSIPELVWYKAIDGSHLMVNNTFCDTVHKTKEQVRGRGHSYIWDVSEDDYENGEYVCIESDNSVIKAGRTCIFEEPVKTRDGMKQFTTYKTPIYDLDGTPVGTVGVAHDVTNFNNMGRELSILVENLHFPLVICDQNWKTVRVNAYFRNVFELSASDMVNFDYRQWKESFFSHTFHPEIKDSDGSNRRELTAVIGGSKMYFTVIEQEIRDYFNNISGYYCLFRDVTLEHLYEERILETANTDALTGLVNRRYFYQFMRENHDKPMTLLYMDLDHFKEVNDNFGHARGDDVLKMTARKISEIIPDGLNARLGGDEFASIILGKYDNDAIENFSQQIQSAVKTLFRADGFRISVSVGVARSGDNGISNIDEFLHEGDEMMYRIKQEHHAMD